MMKKEFISLASLILIISLISFSSAAITNASVTVIDSQGYEDIWLGLSTGGYKLLAEKGTTYTFRIFIKNGMSDRSLHNVQLSPNNFPLEITSITPNLIEQIKPMEIRIYHVNISIPETAEHGKYPMKFDVSSQEFPKGVFSLESELNVVRKINSYVYVLYLVLIITILGFLFYRKIKQSK